MYENIVKDVVCWRHLLFGRNNYLLCTLEVFLKTRSKTGTLLWDFSVSRCSVESRFLATLLTVSVQGWPVFGALASESSKERS